MATKKKSMKKSMPKKSMKTNSKMMKSDMSCGCGSGYFGKGYGCVKLASMAFILFLVTVWMNPVGQWLIRVHWGWYLGIFVIFSAIAMAKMCKCKKM